MAGIPRESLRVLRESLGSSHNRLTSAEDYLEAYLSGYPPVGLLDARNICHAEERGNRLPRPERRGLRSPWGHRILLNGDLRAKYPLLKTGRLSSGLVNHQKPPNLIVFAEGT